MDSRTTDRGIDDRGITSVQFLLASVLALFMFMALANVVVVQYARGSLRSALDQGVRVGAIHREVEVCEERIAVVLADLLAGEIGRSVEYNCSVAGDLITASASAVVRSWTPLTGEFNLDLTAEAAMEPDAG